MEPLDEIDVQSKLIPRSPQPVTSGVKTHFRTPPDLEVSQTPISRVLLIGQCLLDHWASVLQNVEKTVTFERILFQNAAELPKEPSLPIQNYDCQVIAVPLRGVIPESHYFGLSYLDKPGAIQLLSDAKSRLDFMLKNMMRWNIERGLLSFVTNFLVPQQNPDGRLLSRYDPRSLIVLIEQLNVHLANAVNSYRNAYMVDIDQIASSLGKRYLQDDSITAINHGGTLGDFGYAEDQKRLEPPPISITKLYEANIGAFIIAIWREARAMLRTSRQIDAIKMVIVDLDDTLWRGVLAEQEAIPPDAVEGWPLGVIEALAFLRRRGIILAVVSKNEEVNVQRIFDSLLKHRFPLKNFALRRINWRPKVANIEELIHDANILPGNVLFVDDNPVERAAVLAKFPGMRVAGADPYSLRRLLLWSAELQVAQITDESADRGTMVQAQGERESARKSLSRTEFLDTLNVKVRMIEIPAIESPHFQRALELLNKTNQFNTTGRRWRQEEIHDELKSALVLVGFFVEDRFTSYGLVGVLLVRANKILQFVMSCRVFGLDVEQAVLQVVVNDLKIAGYQQVEAKLAKTEANFPCRNVYQESGFGGGEEVWILDTATFSPEIPKHIEIIGARENSVTVPIA